MSGPSVTAISFSDVEEIRTSLALLSERAAPYLPSELDARVCRVVERMLDALPLAEQAPPGDPYARDLLLFSVDYLPRTVETFFAFPPSARLEAKGRAGLSPAEELSAQIGVFEQGLDSIVDGLSASRLSELSANGRFLRDRVIRDERS